MKIKRKKMLFNLQIAYDHHYNHKGFLKIFICVNANSKGLKTLEKLFPKRSSKVVEFINERERILMLKNCPNIKFEKKTEKQLKIYKHCD